ncbi:phosphoesterase [Clostridia bacterium]|nr:phosphoesterase [Clostridia bacterium]
MQEGFSPWQGGERGHIMSIINPVDRNKVNVSVNGRQYQLLSDLHTHTVYSHGKGSVEDNIRAALDLGIRTIGIADHGPGHLGFGVPRKKLTEQKAEIRALRLKYPDVEILFGVEANIIATEAGIDIKPQEFSYFDFVCAGWHYGAMDGLSPGGIASTLANLARSRVEQASQRQIKRNTDMIVHALEHDQIKFLTHPGDKAPVDLLEIAAVCARTGTLIEINTSHMSLTAEDLRMMMLTDVRFIVNSDAHTPDRVGDFLPALALIAEAGIGMERVVNLQCVS